jgi:tetratricopeptide (TPR) repeat protein
LNDLATSYEILGNHDKALKYYRKAIAISPFFTDPLLNMSIIFYNSNSLDSSYYYFQRINIYTKSNNYISLRKMILPRIIKQTSLDFSDNKAISNAFQSFLASEEWMIEIYKHSIENNNSIEKQLITEAIYLLEKVDKTMNKQEADQLRGKYGIN